VVDQKLLDAQVAVLGSILIDPSIAGMVLAESREEDFTGAQYRAIYAAIRDLFVSGEPIDPVTVKHKAGGVDNELILGIMDVTPTAANVQEYIKIMRERAKLQRLRELGAALINAADTQEAEGHVVKANELLCDRAAVKSVDINQGILRFFERQNAKKEYLNWGIPQLDDHMYTDTGDFVVIGGRPSAGKTALALNFAWHIAKTKNVGFFSLETGEEKAYDRLMAHVAKVDFRRIKQHALTEADYKAIASCSGEATTRRFALIEANGMTVHDIQAYALSKRYEVIFVDYLQMIPSSGHNRTEEVAKISLGLHNLAQRNGIIVVALAQLSRPERAQEQEKAPTMASLKESGQIEQDADAIMLLYLDNPLLPSSDRKLKIAKNKEGTTGLLTLAFSGQYQEFTVKTDRLPKSAPPDEDEITMKELGWIK